MNKKGIVFCLLAMVVFSAEAAYVRKVREPDFFIPEKDKMHKPEKLPKIIVKKPKTSVNNENFKEIPEYKTKYNKYLADLAVFSKTGVLKENPEVEKDLSAMQSGEVFEVEPVVSEKITTKEQRDFYRLAAKILNN